MDELRAFLFGVTLAAAIGPIALLVVRIGLHHGLRAALASALGVALADFTYAALALGCGAALAASLSAHRRLFELGTATLLLTLGVWLVRGALRPDGTHAVRLAAVGLLPTYLLTLANPLTILLFVGFSGQLALAPGWHDPALFALLIFLGSLPMQAVYALFGSGLRPFLKDPRRLRAFNLASALGVAAFGAYGLTQAL